MKVKINGKQYTLIQIVSETKVLSPEERKAYNGEKTAIVAMAYLYDKNRSVIKLEASLIETIE